MEAENIEKLGIKQGVIEKINEETAVKKIKMLIENSNPKVSLLFLIEIKGNNAKNIHSWIARYQGFIQDYILINNTKMPKAFIIISEQNISWDKDVSYYGSDGIELN